jgi:hypothetical protein
MTTTTHSPGPWIIETRLHVHAIKDANGQDLTYQDTEPQPDAGSVTSRGRSANETLANARLIAAAPELLEALQDLFDIFPVKYQHDAFTIKVLTQAANVLSRAKQTNP